MDMKYIKIHDDDNVLVALENMKKGITIANNIKLQESIDRGHKIAAQDIAKGDKVIKYGYPIGHAIIPIIKGEWIHTHNLMTGLEGTLTYSYNQQLKPLLFEDKKRTYKGYLRDNGEVGIRNELWIVPTVSCVNGTADNMLRLFKQEVDNIYAEAITVQKHPYGCSQIGKDHADTVTILSDIVKHPNAGGVLVLGLGCENNTIDTFKESLGDYDENKIKFLVCQDVEDECQEGVRLLKVLNAQMKDDKREDVPLSTLKIGLKCGGSDGLSGITANPLLGKFSDFLVSRGGTTILTEVPEMFGAETILMNRARNEEIYHKTVALINDFKNYYKQYNQPIYENPSPGNKKGGISTLEDKSLGCVQKGGTATVEDVIGYGERVTTHGLNLLSAPGNDLVATTALGAAGCQMVLFTTGRGTPFGGFIPTVKVSTNTALYNKKRHWIDFNAGELIEGTPIGKLMDAFVVYLIDVASGKRVHHEERNIQEIAIFKTGVTL